jgi:hypothetical protein
MDTGREITVLKNIINRRHQVSSIEQLKAIEKQIFYYTF